MRYWILAVVVACSSSSSSLESENVAVAPNVSEGQRPDPAPAPARGTLSAKALAGLSSADQADGLEDKIVEECAGCSLQMAGDPAYVIEVEGYNLHMCNESCKDGYEKELSKNLEALVH